MAEVLTKICYGLCAILATLSISILAYINQESIAELPSEQTTSATTAETTEPIQEPTVVTTPATEATEPPQTQPPKTQPEETEPPVMLYDVPLSEDLQLYIIELCEPKGIDPAIVMAMIWRESCFDPNAVGDNGNSLGLMQVQPRWCAEWMEQWGCTDLMDPYQNVTIGIAILAGQLDMQGGDIAKAVTVYNWGEFPGEITQYAKDVLQKAQELQKG